MHPDDKKEIIKRYTDRLNVNGPNIKALASGVEERRQIRFQVLSEVGDLRSSSILDIGCGFGDFLNYLRENGFKGKYTGIDIVPEFIDICKDRFPEAEFKVMDFDEATINESYDYIICSQVFNNLLQHDDNYIIVENVIKKCYGIFNKGMAIDFLTNYVDFKEEHLFYFDPNRVFNFCKNLTKRVNLRHDYPLFEFTIYLYKDFSGWGKGRS
jgi:SAM-dependent methyltransferase